MRYVASRGRVVVVGPPTIISDPSRGAAVFLVVEVTFVAESLDEEQAAKARVDSSRIAKPDLLNLLNLLILEFSTVALLVFGNSLRYLTQWCFLGYFRLTRYFIVSNLETAWVEENQQHERICSSRALFLERSLRVVRASAPPTLHLGIRIGDRAGAGT
jgi:hypothetical protein